jgi:hypothetical protein
MTHQRRRRLSLYPLIPRNYLPEKLYVVGAYGTDGYPVSSENTPPIANAGTAQTVGVGSTVSLDGSGSSDADGDPLTYNWFLVSVPTGSGASLSTTTGVRPTFVADLRGSYLVELIVNDGTDDSPADRVTITTTNSLPIADAGGDQSVRVDDLVTLDGSGSNDPDGDLLSFSWEFESLPDGSSATLSDAGAVDPSFVADVDGTYVVRLVVSDGIATSAVDRVTVTTENTQPVANAGADQSVLLNDVAVLDGSGSTDADGDLLTFFWSFATVPDGSAADLSDPTAVRPSFTVDVPGDYVVQLVVNDGLVNSLADTVVVSTQNLPPVADAGPDQSAFVGDVVLLDGTGSTDPELDPLTYAWALTSRPAQSSTALSDPTLPQPTLPIDRPGTYVVRLVVNDGMADSAPDWITITTANSRPSANAGPDQEVLVGELVELDGSLSSDPDFDELTFTWSFTASPEGNTATLAEDDTVSPTFVPDAVGTYAIQLVVSDGVLASIVLSRDIKTVPFV